MMTARRWLPVRELSGGEILEALNTLDHQLLAHEVFMKCFTKAVKSKEVSGLKKSSLFRMTLAYFLLVSDAPARFLAELQAHQG